LINLQNRNQLTFVNQKLPARHLSHNYAILILHPNIYLQIKMAPTISERRKNCCTIYLTAHKGNSELSTTLLGGSQ